MPGTKSRDNIKRLQEEIRRLEASPENARRKSCWKMLPRTARDQWRGVPHHDGSWLSGSTAVPVAVDMQPSFWARKFGFSLREYYLDPAVYLENYLRLSVERFTLFPDDIFLVRRIPIWMSCGYEGSLFGLRVHFFDDRDPWLDHTPVINDLSDIDRIGMPQFGPGPTASGMMQDAFRMYEGIRELVDSDFEVLFPEWIRGPFGVAVYIRGFERLLTDLAEAPEDAVRVISYVTEARKKWYMDLAAYLGTPVPRGNLFNDEVNCPSLSPSLYRQYILPFEQDLCRFHNGLHYWHSCGDVTPLLPAVAEIPEIDLFHTGPWTDVATAAQVFGARAPLEICMNPQKDVVEATEEEMAHRIDTLLTACARQGAGGLTFRLSAFSAGNSIEEAQARAQLWCHTAKSRVLTYSHRL